MFVIDLRRRLRLRSRRRDFSLVGVVHDGLHVVSWEKPGDAVADSLKPAVVILLDDVDDGSLHEGQLVLLVLGIVIDGHNWKKD